MASLYEIAKDWKNEIAKNWRDWKLGRDVARTLKNAGKGLDRDFNAIPYLLTLTIAAGEISLPNVPYLQPKETRNLIRYIEDSAKAERHYKEVVYPSKIAERDSVMSSLNAVDSIVCDGCSKIEIERYLEGKKKVYEKLVVKIGYSDIAAAQIVARRCSKVKLENIPKVFLPGIYFWEARARVVRKKGDNNVYAKDTSSTGCVGATGVSCENSEAYKKIYGEGDPSNPRSNIKMADWLYGDNKRVFERYGGDWKEWKGLVAHAIGVTKTNEMIEISKVKGGRDNYVSLSSDSALWFNKKFFGKNNHTRALANYPQKISVGYEVSMNPGKYRAIVKAREDAKQKRHKSRIMLAQK